VAIRPGMTTADCHTHILKRADRFVVHFALAGDFNHTAIYFVVMSFRSSSSRLISAIPRSSRARTFATSSSACYPRMTNNRFAPPSEISSSSDDVSGSTSSVPSSTPSASSSSTPRTPKVSLPDQNFVDADYDAATALASARQRAWYLEEEEEVASKPKPKDAPNFVTFDPERTTTSRGSSRIKPLPTDAPAELGVLHQWLTSREAAYVLDTSSVVFLNTRTAGKHMTGEGEVIKVEGVDIAAPVWSWVVVAVVKGRGKGVVGRAERALRVWVSLAAVQAAPDTRHDMSYGSDYSCIRTRLDRLKGEWEGRRVNCQECQKRPTGRWFKCLNCTPASTCSRWKARRDGISRVCGARRAKGGKRSRKEVSGSQRSPWAGGDCCNDIMPSSITTARAHTPSPKPPDHVACYRPVPKPAHSMRCHIVRSCAFSNIRKERPKLPPPTFRPTTPIPFPPDRLAGH